MRRPYHTITPSHSQSQCQTKTKTTNNHNHKPYLSHKHTHTHLPTHSHTPPLPSQKKERKTIPSYKHRSSRLRPPNSNAATAPTTHAAKASACSYRVIPYLTHRPTAQLATDRQIGIISWKEKLSRLSCLHPLPYRTVSPGLSYIPMITIARPSRYPPCNMIQTTKPRPIHPLGNPLPYDTFHLFFFFFCGKGYDTYMLQ